MTSSYQTNETFIDLEGDIAAAAEELQESHGSNTSWDELNVPRTRFNPRHYTKACQVLRALQSPEKKLRRPNFVNDEERILTYELTVAVLKYTDFLTQALESCEFHKRFPKLQTAVDEELLVVLYDLFERDFRVHPDDQDLGKHYTPIQSALLSMSTKIKAKFARLRIQYHTTNGANFLLPENLRNQKYIDQNPLYGWINFRKIGHDKFANLLHQMGLEKSDFEDDTLIQENSYYIDSRNPDLVRFHSSKKTELCSSSLVQEGLLVVQDKSACIPCYTLVKALFYQESAYQNAKSSSSTLSPRSTQSVTNDSFSFKGITLSSTQKEQWFQNILRSSKKYPQSNSIIVTHAGSGRTVAHLACLLQSRKPRWTTSVVSTLSQSQETDLASSIQSSLATRPVHQVLAFGVPASKHDELSRFIKKQMQLSNVKLYHQDFLEVDPKDPRIRGACAILINPPSSGSALKDPVAYVCAEGGDEDVLVHLSNFVKSQKSCSKSQGFSSKIQLEYLEHALTFPHFKLILYTTCSLLAAENTEVVETALANFKQEVLDQKILLVNKILNKKKKSKSFREPVIDAVSLDALLDGYTRSCFNGPYMEMVPSSASSGCFMALMRRREIIVSVTFSPSKELRSELTSSVLPAIRTVPSEATSQVLKPEINLPLVSTSTAVESSSVLIDKDLCVKSTLMDLDSTDTKSSTRSSRAGLLVSGSGTLNPPAASSRCFLKMVRKTKPRKPKKEAIVQRVATPTHSSMIRQSQKKLGSGSEALGFGSTTPAAGLNHVHHHSDEHKPCQCPVCARKARMFSGYDDARRVLS